MADVAEKGFFGKALGLFVETDEQSSNQPATPSSSKPATAPAAVAAFDQEMAATLQKVIDGRKTPYTALLEASAKLATIIPDDTQRLKAAFVTISGDRSLSDVVKAIDVHVSDLEGQLMRFRQTSEAQLKLKAGGKLREVELLQTELTSNDSRIAAAKAEIERLVTRNAEVTAQVGALKQEAEDAEHEIKAVLKRFEDTATYLTLNLTATKKHLSSVLA